MVKSMIGNWICFWMSVSAWYHVQLRGHVQLPEVALSSRPASVGSKDRPVCSNYFCQLPLSAHRFVSHPIWRVYTFCPSPLDKTNYLAGTEIDPNIASRHYH